MAKKGDFFVEKSLSLSSLRCQLLLWSGFLSGSLFSQFLNTDFYLRSLNLPHQEKTLLVGLVSQKKWHVSYLASWILEKPPPYFAGAIYVKENNFLPEGNFYKLRLFSSIKLNYNYWDLVLGCSQLSGLSHYKIAEN